jgi:hypothetical protein
MKEIFFKGVAVALPIVLFAGIGYLIFRGFYELYEDIQLKRELKQIRRESVARRAKRPATPHEPPIDPTSTLD